MTDNVVLSPNRTVESHPITKTIAHGAASPGWIVPPSDPTYSVAVSHDEFNSTLNAFAISTETSSLTVTIETGEAFLEGAWVARNETEDVTLSANSTTMLYLGYSIESPDTILIGDETTVLDDPDVRRMELFEVETDASGVPSGGVTDRRTVGRRIETPNTLYDSDQSGIVDEAEHATTADTADSADVAGTADSADIADTADRLAGVAASNFARTDQNETFNANISLDDNDITSVRQIGEQNTSKINFPDPLRIFTADSANAAVEVVSGTSGNVMARFRENEAIDFPEGTVRVDTNQVVVSSDGTYDIQKNGTDGSGIINFKTQ